MTSSAREPAHRMINQVDSAKCQNTCAQDFSCNGYSWSKLGSCLLWMQPDLWGGGSQQGGYSCVIKQYAVLTSPVKSTGQFIMAGPGMCKTGWDTLPASTFIGKVSQELCRTNCQGDTTCTGFSWQPSKECAVHYEAGLRSSRTTYTGSIMCFVKVYEQAGGDTSGGQYANNVNSGYNGGPAMSGYSGYNGPTPQGYTGGPGYGAAYAGVARGTAAGMAVGAARGQQNSNYGYPEQGNDQGTWPSAGGQISGNVRRGNNDDRNSGNRGNEGINGDKRGDNSPQHSQGHSTASVIGAGALGAGASLLGSHLLGRGNNGNNNNNGNNGQPSSQRAAGRAFYGQTGNVRSEGSGHPFQFWTPNNTGSATCKTDLPTRYFPGKTPALSNAAWPSQHQPRNLECWSKDSKSSLRACWYKKILFSTDRGWPGKCEGLMIADTKGFSCEESCARNPSCPVWQEFWEGSNLVCMQGRGRDCPGIRSRSRINVKAAQRIQHGSVRVLMSLKGHEIKNLRQDFDKDYYSRKSDATTACKYLCYSDVQCTYWVYSTTDGCWVEDPPMHSVAYPLTQGDVNQNSEFARSVIDGEFILHRCPENDGTFTSEDEGAKFTMLPWEWNWIAIHAPWEEGGWSWTAWLMFTIFTCCCCGCCFLFCGVMGVCKLIKNRLRGKTGDGKRRRSDSDSESDSDKSDSSSSSESEKQNRHGSSKQSLLQTQHFNSLAQGHGQQATHLVHSSGGSLPGNRPGYGGAQLHG